MNKHFEALEHKWIGGWESLINERLAMMKWRVNITRAVKTDVVISLGMGSFLGLITLSWGIFVFSSILILILSTLKTFLEHKDRRPNTENTDLYMYCEKSLAKSLGISPLDLRQISYDEIIKRIRTSPERFYDPLVLSRFGIKLFED